MGHTLAGLSGFMLVSPHFTQRGRVWLLLGSVFLANFPDLDILPGLMIGDPRVFHHQGMHSLVAAVVAGVIVGFLSGKWEGNRLLWGGWGGGLYFSHVLLDLLVDDRHPPFGAQLFWPFSQTYFIAPVTPFSRFDYFDSELGMIQTMLSLHNLGTILREGVLMVPFVVLSWYVGERSKDFVGHEKRR
jgi:inner membrane protein